MKKSFYRTSSAFTLLELLIVFFIIALLSTLAYVSLENARAKGRDTRRLADIHNIRQALELYKDIECNYPEQLPAPQQSFVGSSGRSYLAPMPSDPKTRQPYAYSSSATSGYHLIFSLEKDTLDYPAGENIITPVGFNSDDN